MQPYLDTCIHKDALSSAASIKRNKEGTAVPGLTRPPTDTRQPRPAAKPAPAAAATTASKEPKNTSSTDAPPTPHDSPQRRRQTVKGTTAVSTGTPAATTPGPSVASSNGTKTSGCSGGARVSSSNDLLDKHKGHANIYRCPGGKVCKRAFISTQACQCLCMRTRAC